MSCADCMCQAANTIATGLNNINQGGGFGQGIGGVIGGVLGGGFAGGLTNVVMNKFNAMSSQISALQNPRSVDKTATKEKPELK